MRTSAIWVIGAATLATPIGQTSLGDYIFTGLQTENWVFVLFGCFAAAGVALIADQLLGVIKTGLARRDRRRVLAGAAGFLAGVGLAVSPVLATAQTSYVIGAKSFTEQFILARLMKQRIEAEGASAAVRAGLGSAVILRALASGEIDAYVNSSGAIWANAMGRSDNPGRAAVLEGVSAFLREEYGVVALGALGFENTYAFGVREQDAERLGLGSLEDLGRVAPQMRIGADLELFGRPEWPAVRDAYGLAFRAQQNYQPAFMYRALMSGDVDVIVAFSSDGRIARYGLNVLDDPLGAIPPYDALVLIAPDRAQDATLRRALQPLIGAIPVAQMRAANERVDNEETKAPPRGAAAALAEAIGLD